MMVPPDAIEAAGDDFAMLGVMGSQIWVNSWASPGELFDIMILDAPAGEWKVEWCSGPGWGSGVQTLMIEDGEDVAIMDGLPAHEGQCYAISITDGSGHRLASTTRPVQLVGAITEMDAAAPGQESFEECGPDNDCAQLHGYRYSDDVIAPAEGATIAAT